MQSVYENELRIKDESPSTFGCKQNYHIAFHRNGVEMGVLDLNGPQMTFSGDAEESAKVFFDLIARSFSARLKEEREAGREAGRKEAIGENIEK